MELALWCDFRVMQEDAYFGVYCRRWGVPLIDGGTVRLPRIVGLERRANDVNRDSISVRAVIHFLREVDWHAEDAFDGFA
jgi:enoyl-CoA hydratase/carnithine racemase